MKFKILLALLLLTYADMVVACDICGCAAGGADLGVLPQFQKHFVGLRYRFSMMETVHPSSYSDKRKVSKHYFHTPEFWARYVPHNRVQIFASMPIVINKEIDEKNVNSSVFGLGDISTQIHVVVLNTFWNKMPLKINHVLQLGSGVKFPTGRYDIVRNMSTLHPNMQPGSGSWDVPFSSLYMLRYKGWGLQHEFSYRLNTTNLKRFKSGDRLTNSIRAFYWKQWNQISLVSNAAFQYEHSFSDVHQGKDVEFSGGYAFFAQFGCDFYYNFISLGVRIAQPFYQRYNQGNTFSYTQISSQLIFLFNDIKKIKKNEIK